MPDFWCGQVIQMSQFPALSAGILKHSECIKTAEDNCPAAMSSPAFPRVHLFEPETVRVMRRAFEDACTTLKLTSRRDRLKERLAIKIIELAAAGEDDANRLASRAIAEFIVRH